MVGSAVRSTPPESVTMAGDKNGYTPEHLGIAFLPEQRQSVIAHKVGTHHVS